MVFRWSKQHDFKVAEISAHLHRSDQPLGPLRIIVTAKFRLGHLNKLPFSCPSIVVKCFFTRFVGAQARIESEDLLPICLVEHNGLIAITRDISTTLGDQGQKRLQKYLKNTKQSGE